MREFPGKALIGVLFQKDDIYQQFLRHLETIEVEIELESEIWKFDSTDYYQEEMGSGLYRIFLSLKGLYPVEQSVSLKNETNSWENEWKEAGKRTLNLDPGYLDLHKVVLLSGKEGSQKIYLGGGIWSDLNLIRKAGRFEALPWTFPDLRESRYHSFFERVRENLKLDLKSIRKD
ncbi:MAG: DUF4416 family protein [SAR324 cluster bacterium]|nr:DUF4416 family protein [SAR324 cluster bacterium]